jgi:hypothetical protein
MFRPRSLNTIAQGSIPDLELILPASQRRHYSQAIIVIMRLAMGEDIVEVVEIEFAGRSARADSQVDPDSLLELYNVYDVDVPVDSFAMILIGY